MFRSPVPSLGPYLFCIPAHAHALMRFHVDRVTASHVTVRTGSGVVVDRDSGAPRSPVAGEDLGVGGPVAPVARARVDAVRTWRGVAPVQALYFSSFAAFQRLEEPALVQYGLPDPDHWIDPEAEGLSDAEEFRQRMFASVNAEGDDPAPEEEPVSRDEPDPEADTRSDGGLAALRRRVIETHPDRGGSEARFSAALAAYQAARDRKP